MTPEALIDLIFTALVAGVLGALFWARLNRLEAAVDELKRDLGGLREQLAGDLGGLREQLAGDIGGVREQMATRSDLERIREEMAVMRSDLTHVALVVGADRPKPMEG